MYRIFVHEILSVGWGCSEDLVGNLVKKDGFLFTNGGNEGVEKMDARLKMSGMTEGREDGCQITGGE
jgi:hypothetical protein